MGALSVVDEVGAADEPGGFDGDRRVGGVGSSYFDCDANVLAGEFDVTLQHRDHAVAIDGWPAELTVVDGVPEVLSAVETADCEQ